MSNNAFSDFSAFTQGRPDNPQETLEASNYYYSGLFAGEMTCSIIKATNHNPPGHYFYSVDMTVSNADTQLLKKVNGVVMDNRGILSPIKGAYNLKARGKENVRTVLSFFRKYPIVVGDLAKNRLVLIERALAYLDTHRGPRVHAEKTEVMARIRKALRRLKEDGVVEKTYAIESPLNRAVVGHFLAGVLDAEGSFGLKTGNGIRKEPFIAMAMKDQKIVELLRDFVDYGSVRLRKDGLYHYEVNQRDVVLRVCRIFLKQYPLQHARQKQRVEQLQRLLNDYTPTSS